MPDHRTPLAPELEALLAKRHDGHGMPRELYQTDALYAEELRRVWQSGWLFAGFAFELPKPGDYITLAVDSTLRAGDARRRWRGACLPQRLPPSWHAAVPRRKRPCARRRLPLPLVDLRAQRRLARLPRHARGRRQVAAGLETPACDGGHGPDLRLAGGDPPDIEGLRSEFTVAGRAAGLRARARGACRRLRGRGQLEAGLGKQPRVLSLRALPPAVRESQLRRCRREDRIARGAGEDRAPPPRASPTSGSLPRRASCMRMAGWPPSRIPSGALVRQQPHAIGRRVRHRVDGRQPRRAADGRLRR